MEWKTPAAVDIVSDEDGVDYMTLSYYQRSVDTDRLEAPPGHVITGVRLRNIGGHVNLEAQVAPVKFADGKLVADRTTWIGNDNTPATPDARYKQTIKLSPGSISGNMKFHLNRRQVDILMPDVPTEYHGSSQIDTSNNQFVQFDSTSPGKDVSSP